MSLLVAFMSIAVILVIGELVSTKTNAWIPSVFVSGVLFLIGFWTVLPDDLMETAGISPALSTLFVYLLITNIGTMLSLDELKQQWKYVIICLVAMVGAIVVIFGFGLLFADYNTVIVGTPPLLGGIVSALLMSEAASNAGLMDLSVLAIVIYVMQGFAGYPLTSIVLKKEGKLTLALHRQGKWHKSAGVTSGANVPEAEIKLFKFIPKEMDTASFTLLRIAFVAFLAVQFCQLIDPLVSISSFVMCLAFGVIARYVGFLEKAPLTKANSYGFAILVLMAFIFDGLKRATPTMLIDLIVPMLVIIFSGVIGLYLFSWVAAKVLKISPYMAFATSLTALYGFPADYILTLEVVKSLTDDPEEQEVLKDHMLPPMLVGGFVTVTIVSVILAGIFVQLIR